MPPSDHRPATMIAGGGVFPHRHLTGIDGLQPHEIASDGRFAYVGGYGVEGWKKPGAGGHVVWVIDLARRALAPSRDLVQIVPTRFGAESGMLGAAVLALEGVAR